MSCAGSGAHAICTTIGLPNVDLNEFSEMRSLIGVSDDGGETWRVPQVFPDHPGDFLTNTHCLKDGPHSFCLAVGLNVNEVIEDSGSLTQIMMKSTQDLGTWERHVLKDLNDYGGMISGIGCTKTARASVCVATGLFEYSTGNEIVITSQDEGVSWTPHVLSTEQDSEPFSSRDVECYQVQGKATCLIQTEAFGRDKFMVVMETEDDGGTWSITELVQPPEKNQSLNRVAVI